MHLEVVEGRDRDQIEGWVPELASEAELRDALEKAFDYRGDVTITRKDGSRVEGYIFDRRNGPTLADSVVRIIPQNSPREDFHSLFRHRRAGLQRTRHRRRQKLGSLGPQVLGEESRRREGHRVGAGESGVGISPTRLNQQMRKSSAAQTTLSDDALTAGWQKRFYDLNVSSTRKRIEKLRYMHRNPVKCGLVAKPDQWKWSSFRFYANG